MRFSCRLLAMTMLCVGTGFAAPAVAGEAPPRVAAAEAAGMSDTGAAGAFAPRGPLNDAALGAVSGQGVDATVAADAPKPGDVSVILFDELGRPKRNGLSSGSGVNSSVARGINVQVR